jgi:hypothetical protein
VTYDLAVILMAAHCPANVDHLVYATPDLASTVTNLEQTLGVGCQAGGQHIGRGTCNVIVSLGAKMYLEIVGPDPHQAPPATPRWFNIDSLEHPKLVAWAAKTSRLDELVRSAAHDDVMLGTVEEGRRELPDGSHLTWKFSDPRTVSANGVIPFFIDWGESRHPADGDAAECDLVALRAEHPNSEAVRKQLGVLEVELEICTAPKPALIAIVNSPRGELELR